MKLIRGLINLHEQITPCVATIGNFDGVHLGHQAIVARVITTAQMLNIPSCVLLFEPHPKEFFMGDNCPARLTCFKQKYEHLESLGIDMLIVLQFNQALRQMEAVDFVNDIIIQRLKVKHLVVGDDFHFGHKRLGNFQLLEQMSGGQYTLEPTSSVLIDNLRVSSTQIRDALAQHQLDKAKRMLGRRFSMKGKVGYGQQLGQTIGFPTANVAVKRKKLPFTGVFLVHVSWRIEDQVFQSWGAANCGMRPTVNGKESRLEVHLLGVSENLYGIELAVDFYAAIRQERKFADISALKHQIEKDIKVAKRLIQQFESEK